ncbi:TPA: isoprenylcysteine carboxylmethyltransferase family protein [Candidatus Woesearchaeota archaeon]|nr:isoprenylcysteine carboxylmethyltransferase family protein [Candidatus Woesearchaeota archaeon]
MNFFDAIALIVIAYVLPIPFAWYIVHNKIKIFIRLGYFNYILSYGTCFAIGYFLFVVHPQLSLFKLSTYYTFIPGIVIALFVIYLDIKRQATFPFRTLIGLPEFMPRKYKSKLITSGIFGYIRHPRYLEYILSALAMAFITGLIISYIFFIYTLFAFNILAGIEEKELVQRFGKKYLAYMKKVPRFIPKL